MLNHNCVLSEFSRQDSRLNVVWMIRHIVWERAAWCACTVNVIQEIVMHFGKMSIYFKFWSIEAGCIFVHE